MRPAISVFKLHHFTTTTAITTTAYITAITDIPPFVSYFAFHGVAKTNQILMIG